MRIEESLHLDDLRLVSKIASGGMAEVWEARQIGAEGFEKRVAVKVVLPHLSDNEEFIRMFLDEGRLAAQLDHPNVAQLYKLGEAAGTYYMAMEYIDGMVLSTLMKEAARRGIFVPYKHSCQILIGACSGLDYAHSCTNPDGTQLNLVHRDISPQNIMISYNGAVKVVDFGIAKAATQLHHTQAGVLKGKYAYMSPEQATGKPLDRRSDIFALGVCLWELTTGHRLFRADNEIATLHKIIGGEYEAPSTYRDDYPPELELIVMKALAPDVNDRFYDCGEMQLALEDFLMRHGMAAGSKRLAHYVRWIMSDDDSLEPPQHLKSSIISEAFEAHSDPGIINTPSPQQAFDMSPRINETPVGEVSPGMMDIGLGAEMPESHRQHRREQDKGGGSGVWIALLILVFGICGMAVTYVVFPEVFNRKKTENISKDQRFWLIRSNPPEAIIFVNGQSKGLSPKMVSFALGKNYTLRLSKRNYEPYVKTFKNLQGAMVKKPLIVTLKKESGEVHYGTLVLQVKPERAEVSLSGRKLSAVAGGVYKEKIRANRSFELTAKLKGYETISKTLTVEPEKKATFDISMKRAKRKRRRRRRRRVVRTRRVRTRYVRPRPAAPSTDASISVRGANVDGAEVSINGSRIGVAPISGHSLKPGRYTVRVTKAGFKPYVKNVAVTSGLESLIVRLEKIQVRRKSVVTINSTPRSRVYLNGRSLGTTPVRRSINTGRYTLRLKTVKFGATYSQSVKLEAGPQKLFHRFKMGRMLVLTRPRARVYLGKDYLGLSNSSKGAYKVPSGKYTVRFVFPDGQARYKRNVYVVGGQRVRVTQVLR